MSTASVVASGTTWSFADALGATQVVGFAPVCDVSADICVSKCFGLKGLVTGCCQDGIFDPNVSMETCGVICDQDTNYGAKCSGRPRSNAAATHGTQLLKSHNATVGRLQNIAWPEATEVPDNLKVAFVGDTDIVETSRAVLTAIAEWMGEDEGFLVIDADMSYEEPANPVGYSALLDEYLGEKFPVFVTVGNHDSDWWWEFGDGSGGFSQVFADRYERTGQSQFCKGELGVNAVCFYKGILIVESGIGELTEKDDAPAVEFIEQALSTYPDAKWKQCFWHKNQRLMQLCSKEDEIGWDAYDVCRRYGAQIVNGHEHSYSRTVTMDNLSSNGKLSIAKVFEPTELGASFPGISDAWCDANCLDGAGVLAPACDPNEKEPLCQPKTNDVVLEEGKTYVMTQGMGGRSLRQDCNGFGELDWWANIAHAGDSSMNPGIPAANSFTGCVYHPEGRVGIAECFTRDINGMLLDKWTITSRVGEGKPVPPKEDIPEQGCAVDYDADVSDDFADSFGVCGKSCCRGKPGGNLCHYTAEDPEVCDFLAIPCLQYPPFSQGGAPFDERCTIPVRDCKYDYDEVEAGYPDVQRYGKCGGSCCRAKLDSSACHHYVDDQTICDRIPSNCTFPSYDLGGDADGVDNRHCIESV